VYYSAVDPNSQKKDDKKGSDRKPEDEAPGARMRGAEAFEITNKQTYNFNSMLRDQILKNTYFKTLVKIDTFEGIMDEMYQYVETAETYGGGSTTVPSSLFCCLYRLFTIGLSYDELNLLCESKAPTNERREMRFPNFRQKVAEARGKKPRQSYYLQNTLLHREETAPGPPLPVGGFGTKCGHE
ncbi:SRL1, partial [Symbiodinium microadriaticum]